MVKKENHFGGFSAKVPYFDRKRKEKGRFIITEKQITEAKAVFLKEGGKITRLEGRFNPELPMYAMELDPREYGHD